MQACDAIAFAHRQLIVHCDLKPSNVLIDQNGRPVLLDFGIARLASHVDANDADGVSATSPPTVAATAVAFTPRYASPEQRQQGTISTVSDIYSLGILLAELLASAHSGGKPAALRTRELDAIISHATKEDPAKRYATVDAFTEDIRRYLRHLPVNALPPTKRYVTQKFLNRRWPLVLAGVAFGATVIGFTFKVVIESQRAHTAEQEALMARDRAQTAELRALAERDSTRLAQAETAIQRDGAELARNDALRERDRATVAESATRSERDRALVSETKALAEKDRATQAESATRQTSDFLISVFDSSNPNAESGDIPASKLIAAAESRLEKQMQGQLATQALLYSALARVQSNMGRPKEARDNFRRAIEIERKQNRPLELARMLTLEFQNDVLKLDNSNLVPLAREALALREQYAPADSEEMAQSLAFMGYALRATSGDLNEAERLLMRSLAIREKIDPESLGTAESLHIAGQVYGVLGQREKAVTAYRRSVAIKQNKLGDGHPEILISLQYLAGELNRARQFDEAETIFRRIVAQNEKLHGRQNVNMLRPLVYLGSVLNATGRSRESLQLGQEALQIAEKTVGRDSTYAALALSNIGLAMADLGDYAGAATHFREALLIMKKYMRPIDNAVAQQEMHLGRTLNWLGQSAVAHPHLLAAYEIYRKVLGDTHRETTLAVTELMRCATAADNLADATIWQRKLKPAVALADKEVLAGIALADAMLAAKQGRTAEASKGFLDAERLYRELYSETDARSWLAMLPRAEWLAGRGQRDDIALSRALANQMLAKLNTKLNPDAPVIAKLTRLQQM